VRTPLALCLPLAVLALSGCSSSDGKDSAAALAARPSATGSPAATSAPRAVAGTTAPAASNQTTRATAAATATSGPTTARALTAQAPGKPAVSKATAAGTYTYDSSGKVTFGTTPQDASGTSTLTVSPLAGDRQHSTLHSDTGDTEQDLLVRDAGTYGASLKITTAAFTKEFRPATAVLLVPDPARVGAAWSWSGTSTDGATKATAANKLVRTETLTIGGVQVPCVVLQTRLVLSGDIDYTADITTWWAPSYRLPVKDHTVGKGSYSGIPFSTDITQVMRSVRPS
jgi:hypothetical protein